MPERGEEPLFLTETDVIVCVECPDWRATSVAQAIGHEHHRHDGAQTCWWQRETTSVG